MTARRCHCGSIMIPLFNFFACKAECDLPPSMRTKPKREGWGDSVVGRLRAELQSAQRQAPVGWTPQVGAWVVTMSQSGATLGSIPFKIDAMVGANAHLSTTGGSYRTVWPIAALARWVPSTGDRVTYFGAPATVVNAIHATTREVVMIRMTSAAAQQISVPLGDLAPAP